MKKNFFKKLSFVMALAMIVSVITPAGGVFAAAKPKLNSTSQYLFLNNAKTGKYDFNISNKQKGWKYAWTSSKTKVATVNKSNGLVTAKAAGTTTVSVVIKDSKGKKLYTLKATVTVRDNIKTLAISNAPTAPINVGEAYDLNRSYTTVAGKTSGSESKTYWFFADKDGKETWGETTGATIDKSGVLTATAVGEYKVVAKAFQSTTKAKAYLADPVANAKFVLASAEATIKAVAQMTSIKQISGTKFEVNFSADVKDIVSASTLKIANASNVNLPIIKGVSFDATGKIATVETYLALDDKEEYTVSCGDMSAKFTSSQGAVATIEITGPALVSDGEPTALEYVCKDANGIEVPKASKANVEFSLSSDSKDAWLDGSNISIYVIGSVAKVKATYHSYDFDANWQEITFDSKEFVVTAVDDASATVTSATAWTISGTEKTDADDYKTIVHQIPLNASGKFLGVKAVLSDGSTVYANNGVTFKFTSTDPTKLIVDPNNGLLTPIATGTVPIIIEKNNFKTIAEVVVVADAKANAAIPDKNGVTLSDAAIDDTAVLTVTVKDQYGNDMDAVYGKVTSVARPKAVDAATAEGFLLPDGTLTNGKAVYRFNAAGRPAGSYQYIVTVSDKNVSFTVVVKTPEKQAVSWRLVVSAPDLAVDKDTKTSDLAKLTVKLYAYDKNSIPIEYINADDLSVKDPDGKEVLTEKDAVAGKTGIYEVAALTAGGASGSAITKKLKTGNYTASGKVIVTENNKPVSKNITTVGFVVKDSQVLPSVKLIRASLTTVKDTPILESLAGLFDPSTNNGAVSVETSVKADNIKASSVSGGAISNEGTYQVFVQKVTVTETFSNGLIVDTDVIVNKNIVVTVE